LLTIINAVDPIYFSFDASESLFLKTKRALGQGEAATRVDIRLQDEPDYRWHGRLDFTDNGLNPRSGTIKVRATLTNPKLFLTPGMFGNMRLASGEKTTALLVPDAAIQTDQARKIVLIVDKSGTVASKPVQLGPVIDGLRIVRSGLSAGDRVIIGGTQVATPGGKVTTKPGSIAPVVVPPQVDAPSAGGEATFAQ
jgi:RND family efflux transporter MFP subunit